MAPIISIQNANLWVYLMYKMTLRSEAMRTVLPSFFPTHQWFDAFYTLLTSLIFHQTFLEITVSFMGRNCVLSHCLFPLILFYNLPCWSLTCCYISPVVQVHHVYCHDFFKTEKIQVNHLWKFVLSSCSIREVTLSSEYLPFIPQICYFKAVLRATIVNIALYFFVTWLW